MANSELKQRKHGTDTPLDSDVQPEHKRPRTVRPGASGRAEHLAYWKIVGRIVLTLVGLNFCLSYLITESFLWGHESKWTNYRNYIPRTQQVYTLSELAKYNGADPDLPLLLAVKGDVYDVTDGWGFYGPGSTYHIFAGRDSSRAFGTSCLSREDHLTHDTRGLSERELAGIEGWHRFFENHQRYVKVGTLKLPPIDPKSPIPPPCDDAKPKP